MWSGMHKYSILQALALYVLNTRNLFLKSIPFGWIFFFKILLTGEVLERHEDGQDPRFKVKSSTAMSPP